MHNIFENGIGEAGEGYHGRSREIVLLWTL
jgi:hypothetical protein